MTHPKPARLWRGADISHHQGNIEPSGLLQQCDYIYLKTSGGDRIPYVDSKFDRNWGLLNGKKPLGGFHFFNPYNQVDFQRDMIYRITDRDGWKVPYSIDTEYPTRAGQGMDAIPITLKFIDQLQNDLERTNHPMKDIGLCGYTAAWWWDHRYKGESCNHIRWWIATFGVTPYFPKGITNVIGWQTSDKGRFIGIQGPVDTDVMAVTMP